MAPTMARLRPCLLQARKLKLACSENIRASHLVIYIRATSSIPSISAAFTQQSSSVGYRQKARPFWVNLFLSSNSCKPAGACVCNLNLRPIGRSTLIGSLALATSRQRLKRGIPALFSAFSQPSFGLASLSSFAAPGKDQPKLILFLTADGFRTDYIEWYNPPTLKQLISEGVRVLHATNVFPTVTAPNMTALVCGAWPRTTAIAGNSQYVAEKDKVVERPRDLKATTIAETLSKAGWTTAAVNHFMLENRGAQSYVGSRLR